MRPARQTPTRATDFHRGDWVFVYPGDACAPREVRGLTGEVKRVRGERAKVVFRSGDTAFVCEVDPQVLNHERRRRERAPAHWSHELAAAH